MNLDRVFRRGDAAPTVAVAIARMPQGHYARGDSLPRTGWQQPRPAAPSCLRQETRRRRREYADVLPQTQKISRIVPALEEEDAINVAIYCRGLARHLPDVPYGLSYNEDGCFEITGKVVQN